ncbi:MAG: DUF3667 domain-containing protein [Prevotella sp.]|nr:DUF3667 domain-containing protein [Prevotella sp.]
MLEELKQKYRRFKEWQKEPYQVKPLSDKEHDCATCGTHFQGNYCPRCGQSSSIGRYSLKNAVLLFLDVWGLGNRGMFRSLRDLVLRPGYMIRDYLQGMQMAYFPPFKMFFLLIAFSVLVDTGLNIKGENRLEKVKMQNSSSISVANEKQKDSAASAQEKETAAMVSKTFNTFEIVYEWIENHQTVFQLLWLLLFSVPLYLFFRHSPAIPDIRYSEFFVAMVYTSNLLFIASIACGLLCLSVGIEMLCYLLTIIPLKQLSGYSYKRTIINIILALVLLFVVSLLVAIAAALAYKYFSKS